GGVAQARRRRDRIAPCGAGARRGSIGQPRPGNGARGAAAGESMLKDGVTLYFVRHGETDWNRTQRYQGQRDIPLNDTGRSQASPSGGVLAEVRGTAAAALDYVASPLVRARETMEIVRRQLALAPPAYRTDDRLREIHYGHWEGQPWTELPRTDPEGYAG